MKKFETPKIEIIELDQEVLADTSGSGSLTDTGYGDDW